jgi:hypothetical protein
MGIISYVPKITAVRDRRKPEGGFYKAECDLCGREFYPSRSNAKFCSQVCAQANYRKKLAEGGGVGSPRKNTSANTEKWIDISPDAQISWGNVKKYFSDKRLKAKFLKIINTMDKIPIGVELEIEVGDKWYKIKRTHYNGFDLLTQGS